MRPIVPAFLSCLISVIAPAARAGTIVVPDSLPTIGAALAVSAAGDTVLVQPGTYPETIVLVDGVALRAANPGQRPVLDGGGAGPVVTALNCGAGTLLEGFEVRNGAGAGLGGGAWIKSSSLRIEGCVFADNSAVHGGGVGAENSAFTMTGCALEGNAASQTGGAISVTGLPSPAISGCTFFDNDALAGGALAVRNGCTPAVSGSLMDSNRADQGGGIWFDLFAGGTVTGCTIVLNAAASGLGGGLFLNSTSAPDFVACIVAMSVTGAGVHAVSGATPTWDCNDLWGNAGGNAVAGGGDLGTNFHLDPQFCDPVSGGSFLLSDTSPCLAGGSCPTLVGALGLGCTAVAVRAEMTPSSWGAVKAGYR
jgi:hypothetical protein